MFPYNSIVLELLVSSLTASPLLPVDVIDVDNRRILVSALSRETPYPLMPVVVISPDSSMVLTSAPGVNSIPDTLGAGAISPVMSY